MQINTTAHLGDRIVGAGHPAFLVFEAGPTHTGVESAKELIRHAKAAGGDAIKFQMTNPERLVADRSQPFAYKVLFDKDSGATEDVVEPLYDILKRRYLDHDQWAGVKEFCDDIGIAMYATVGFVDDLRHLIDIGCPAVKIASNDVNHYPLIREAARANLNIQLDTGNARLGEIEYAIDLILAEGNDNIIVHHCPTGYPARLDGINLRIIETLREMFGCAVAFSDHSPGWDMDIAALALGANMIEKTITKNRMTRSVEHMFSLEPDDARRFVESIRAVETGMGLRRRVFTPEEERNRTKLRRSVFLTRALQVGDVIDPDVIEFRRPGFGIGPDRWDELAGARAARELPAEHMLTWADVNRQ